MTERTFTHLALVTKNAKSLKTTIPRSVVAKLKLKPSDMLEWVDVKEGIFVKKL